jgi:hypothetical protein
LSLRIMTSWSANGTHDGADKGGICNEAVIERRREVIPQVGGRAVPECRRQGFVDGLFEREDFGDAQSLLHFLGIESVEALGQDRRIGRPAKNRPESGGGRGCLSYNNTVMNP